MKIIIFGAGNWYKKYKTRLNNLNISAFIDNSAKKQGTYLDGIYIDTPDNIGKYKYEYIILMSEHYKEMRGQLLDLGVSAEKIIDKDNLGFFERYGIYKYYCIRDAKPENSKGKIVLCSHQMSLTGAPRVLFNMACILKEEGYYVEIYSSCDGELTYELLKMGIAVKIFNSDEDISRNLKLENQENEIDMIVVCTFCLADIVIELSGMKTPVIWWVHEVEDAYVGDLEFVNKLENNIHVYGGGWKAVENYRYYTKNDNIQELLYGIQHRDKKTKSTLKSGKIVFAIVATMEPRKGHHVFFEAVNRHWNEWKDYAEFWSIGKIIVDCRDRIKYSDSVKFFDSLEYEELLECYDSIDVVVCPSNRDPMPVVIAEGMMLEKVCIVSDVIGPSKYIKSYENGLVCKVDDVENLSNAIQWVLDHPEQCEMIGKKAYEVYQNYYSLEAFRTNIVKIVEMYI